MWHRPDGAGPMTTSPQLGAYLTELRGRPDGWPVKRTGKPSAQKHRTMDEKDVFLEDHRRFRRQRSFPACWKTRRNRTYLARRSGNWPNPSGATVSGSRRPSPTLRTPPTPDAEAVDSGRARLPGRPLRRGGERASSGPASLAFPTSPAATPVSRRRLLLLKSRSCRRGRRDSAVVRTANRCR